MITKEYLEETFGETIGIDKIGLCGHEIVFFLTDPLDINEVAGWINETNCVALRDITYLPYENDDNPECFVMYVNYYNEKGA